MCVVCYLCQSLIVDVLPGSRLSFLFFMFFVLFFFFKQKTAYEIKECDWSSDVCSSDLSILLGREESPIQRSREANRASLVGAPESIAVEALGLCFFTRV